MSIFHQGDFSINHKNNNTVSLTNLNFVVIFNIFYQVLCIVFVKYSVIISLDTDSGSHSGKIKSWVASFKDNVSYLSHENSDMETRYYYLYVGTYIRTTFNTVS